MIVPIIHAPGKTPNKISTYKNLVAASVIVPTLLFVLIMWIDHDSVVSEAEKQVVDTCNVFQQHALTVFDTQQLVAERVDERIKRMSWQAIEHSPEIHAFLKDIQSEYPQVYSIVLIDPAGVPRNASLPLPASSISMADRDYFPVLRERDAGMFVSRLVKGRIANHFLFSIASRRHNGSGSFDGVIVVTAAPEYFAGFWNMASPVKQFTANLIRDDGSILARAPFIKPEITTLKPPSLFMQAVRKAEQGSYYGISIHDSIRKFHAFKKVGRFNAYLVYGVAENSIRNAWRRHFLEYGFIFIAAITALTTMSLQALRHARQEQDDLERLSRSYDELEQRVAERTAELRVKDQLLLQQNRMAAMGEMLNNIAHQWRQPLNILGLNVQRLSLFYKSGKFTEELLDTSTRDAMKVIQHMSRTIDDFRNFFIPNKEKVDFEVKRAIEQTLGLVADSFKHDRIEIVPLLSEAATVHGYPNEFSHTILNILQNARETLVERNVADGRVTIVSSSESGKTVITITDNAGGIAEEIIDEIFQPYFSTKGLQGTGIGLYMSKVIIEANMGGTLTARNVPGGAEFRIEI